MDRGHASKDIAGECVGRNCRYSVCSDGWSILIHTRNIVSFVSHACTDCIELR